MSVGEGALTTVIGLVDIFSSIGWAATAAALAPILDVAFMVWGTIATFQRTDELARLNGWCSGFAQAIADMAYAYRDPKLDISKPETWPNLTKPSPHLENAIDLELGASQ